LQLQPGRTYLIEGSEESESRFFSTTSSPIVSSSKFIQGILGVAFVLVIILYLRRLILRVDFSKMKIRENLEFIATLALILFVIYILSLIGPAQSAKSPGDPLFEAQPTAIVPDPSQIGEVPRTAIWLAAGILVGGMSLLVVLSVTSWLSPTRVSGQILQEAENAVQNLKAGKELSDVIVRCYAQMAQTLREQRGIERNHAMTVREFEDWLEYEGFPLDPVHQLTSLFEAARYSKRLLGIEDRENALQCLNKIISYCQGEQ